MSATLEQDDNSVDNDVDIEEGLHPTEPCEVIRDIVELDPHVAPVGDVPKRTKRTNIMWANIRGAHNKTRDTNSRKASYADVTAARSPQ